MMDTLRDGGQPLRAPCGQAMENTLRGFPHPDTHLPTLPTSLGLGHHEFEKSQNPKT
jgi:hypothetical protein